MWGFEERELLPLVKGRDLRLEALESVVTGKSKGSGKMAG